MEGHSTERGLPYFRKARSPQEERVMGSRSKWLSVADLRARDGGNSSRSSEIQLFARPSWVLYTRQSTLYSTLQCTGSQWRSLRTGVMRSHAHATDHFSRDVLDLYCSLVTASIFGYSSEQGIVEVQPRCQKGVDNPFTRVSVQELPDPANVLNLVQRRLTYGIHFGGPW